MKTIYTDKNGAPVSIGDILKYDEGEGYSKTLDEVVEVNGEPYATIRVGDPKWTEYTDDGLIHLRYFKVFSRSSDEVLYAAEVIGNIRDNPERLTADYANEIWPITVHDGESS